MLARLAEIRRVLVVCPASLKSQWRAEITKFSGRSTQIVIGSGEERIVQYQSDAFFTICNYEQVLRDLSAIENVPWDLIILDEGQRIKNYESKTSNVIRQLESPFRLVLSGTPLENRLGELFTVARFIDDDLVTTLAAKQDLADASINISSDVNEVAMQSGMEDLKRRLEVILPPKLAAPLDESQQRRVEAEAERLAGEKRREQVAQAGGQLLSAALSLAGGLVGNTAAEPDQAKVDALTSKLGESIERDEQGRPQLKISLPSDEALRDLATTLARLLG